MKKQEISAEILKISKSLKREVHDFADAFMNEAEKQMLPSTGMLHQGDTTALPHGAAEIQVSGLEASSLHPPQQELPDFAVSLKN